ncbi:signal peptidase II [Maribellus maritimus]|uniref:signal peptidase II n=1 Tax=Maribellus maritimus TaxID=2870838 RepID=UPI001EEAE8D6|nr:signal peptidase II [Maribellus maritimus]MCG6191583.1 signal peptidase II [Maribellus maritimus]
MKKTIIKYLVLISFMISGCSADLKTKEIAKTNLKDNSIVLIKNTFDLRYVENHSIAFGFLSSIKKSIRLPLIFILTISATMFAFVMIWKIKNKKFRLLLPFFILIGGAYGNILDRMFNGFVTDFFHVHYFYEYNFPVFNVADVLVNVGVFLIIIQWKDFRPIFDDLFKKENEILTE